MSVTLHRVEPVVQELPVGQLAQIEVTDIYGAALTLRYCLVATAPAVVAHVPGADVLLFPADARLLAEALTDWADSVEPIAGV